MADSTLTSRLAEGLGSMGIDPSGVNLQKTADYAALLEKWNKTYNLTAVREMERILGLHLLDSLSVLPYLGPDPLLDAGSGGGLPGIPLAIARPALPVTLLDSNSKKSAFQRQCLIDLVLPNVTVVNQRAEQHRSQAGYGQIISRAFSDIAAFIAATRHLLAPGGRWLAMKGVYPGAELDALPASASVVAVHPLVVPGVDGDRHLIVLMQN